MKTIVKLKRDMAAIVFSPQGCQLIYPERPEGEGLPEHFSLAGAVVMAVQYQIFVDAMFAFLQEMKKGQSPQKEVTH